MTKIINSNPELDFDDVMISPVVDNDYPVDSRMKVGVTWDLTPSFNPTVRELGRVMHSRVPPKTFIGTGIIAANMTTVGTVRMAKELARRECFTALHKNVSNEEISGLDTRKSFVTFGMNNKHNVSGLLRQFKESFDIFPPLICLDVANGYLPSFHRFVQNVRRMVGENSVIMAGNVICGAGALSLFHSGADIIKVGIGSGGQCLTRNVTGVGRPQLSAVMDCKSALLHTSGMICSDGGCKSYGDIAKAYVAGADFVMLGSMLGGHDECLSPEELDSCDENTTIYGMSSHVGRREISPTSGDRTSEGRVSVIKRKGPVSATIGDILGALRSTCTYTASKNISELKEQQFYKVRR